MDHLLQNHVNLHCEVRVFPEEGSVLSAVDPCLLKDFRGLWNELSQESMLVDVQESTCCKIVFELQCKVNVIPEEGFVLNAVELCLLKGIRGL